MRRLRDQFNAFIRAMLGDLSPTGHMWARVGVVVLIVAAGMSFDFGRQVSWLHGVFLAGLTFVAAFGPEAAYKAWQERKFGSAIAMAIFTAGLLAIEFNSHQSYTAGLRGDDLAGARVQNAKYNGAQDAVSEDKTNVEMWRKQLATLREQNAWAGTVKAEGLRAELDSAQKAIDLEAARGGCKAKCLVHMQAKADLEKRIAIAEQASDLERRIEATQRILDTKREVAATTEHRSSVVEHSNRAMARTIAFFTKGELKPDAKIETGAELSANLMMALAGTGVPAFALFVAGLYRREEDINTHLPHAPRASSLSATPPTRASAVALHEARVAPAPAQHTREIVRTDNAVWSELRGILRAA